MNKDRGTIKWNALMLPEHVKLLRDWQAEDEQVKKPTIDSWQLEEFNDRLQLAISQHVTVAVTIWQAHELHVIESKVARFNQATNTLFFSSGETITFDQIIHVELQQFE